MSVPYIIVSSWLSVCQKLSNLVEFYRSSDKNNLGHFFGAPCILCFSAVVFVVLVFV